MVIARILLIALFSLVVSGCGGGGSGGSSGSSGDTNSTPVANAGADQNVATGSTVNLDASASSDADGDMLTYAWSFQVLPNGSSATLSNPASVSPSFTADMDGEYIVRLTVTDGTDSSSADTVSILASSANSTPVAIAGSPQNVATGSLVLLNGGNSYDADNDPLTYAWEISSKPSLSTATLSDPTNVTPTFTADAEGEYSIVLRVSDGTATSAASTTKIIASSSNSVPVANAGNDQNVVIGRELTLDGTASSDADNDSLTYDWRFTSLPDGSNATLSDNSIAQPSLTPDIAGNYVVTLRVDDGTEESETDSVIINAEQSYTDLFEASSQTNAVVTNDSWQPGSRFILQLANNSSYPFTPTLLEVSNGSDLNYSSSELVVLIGRELAPGEEYSLLPGRNLITTFILSYAHAGDITMTYHLKEAQTDEEIIFQQKFLLEDQN